MNYQKTKKCDFLRKTNFQNPIEGDLQPAKLDDLHGYWALIAIELTDVDECFEKVLFNSLNSINNQATEKAAICGIFEISFKNFRISKSRKLNMFQGNHKTVSMLYISIDR